MSVWIKMFLIVAIMSTAIGLLMFMDDELLSVFMAPAVILLAVMISLKTAWYKRSKKSK